MTAAAMSCSVKKMIESKVIMAPMSGITDIPFRRIVRRFGCRFAFTEMIDVNSIYYGNKKAHRFLDKGKEEGLLGVQILGQDIGKIITVARICEDKGFEILDFNAGCPARKVIKGGKGSALLKAPGKLGQIIRELVKALGIPVTVKIRSGWDEENINYLEIARIVESEGASAICVHPRTRKQMYKGKPDHDAVRTVKNSIEIPVFASGNMFEVKDVANILNTTGCDGVFIARGALGRPWIFRDIDNYFNTGHIPEDNPDFEFVKQVMLEHFGLIVDLYGESRGIRLMYKHICWYLKKRKNLDAVMKEFRKIGKYPEAKEFIETLAQNETGSLVPGF